MQVCTLSQTTTPTSHHSVFYRPDALPAAQPTASKHWRQLVLESVIVFFRIYRLKHIRSCFVICRRYRYTAYRHFVRWCWGYIGKHVRIVLPSCVIHAIRTAFPSETYSGFKLPALDWTLMQKHRSRPTSQFFKLCNWLIKIYGGFLA